MTGRLFIISNRVPMDGPPAGGLVVALHECLAERGGTWVGTSGQTVDVAGDKLRTVPGDGYDLQVFDLTHSEHEAYYLGYANSVLWPLCHRRTDLMSLSEGSFAGYIGVNERLARMLAPQLQADDVVWIHDYHFLPLAKCLRACGVTARLGYFHHIPFPASNDLAALPEADAVFDWIASFDLVGVQTKADVATALDLYRGHSEGEQLLDGRVSFRGRDVAIRSFPIGIDAKAFQAEAACGDARDLLRLDPNDKLVIGVDRLDYSKGLNNRLRAFGRFLDNSTDDTPRTSLLQIAPPTRQDVQAYQEIRREMEHTSARLNGLHARLGWTPIQYIHRAVPRETLAVLYRGADVALVTPFADGMNLVAKEYVAAQDPLDPGVLILSRFAGAAEQLEGALLVNPHNVEEMGMAIATALSLQLEERRERYNAMRAAVFDTDITHWTNTYLSALRTAPDGSRQLEQNLQALSKIYDR